MIIGIVELGRCVISRVHSRHELASLDFGAWKICCKLPVVELDDADIFGIAVGGIAASNRRGPDDVANDPVVHIQPLILLHHGKEHLEGLDRLDHALDGCQEVLKGSGAHQDDLFLGHNG